MKGIKKMSGRLCSRCRWVRCFITSELMSSHGGKVIGGEGAHNFNQRGNKEVLETAEEGVK